MISDQFLVLLQALVVESKVQSENGHTSIDVTSEPYQHGSQHAGEAEGSHIWPGQGKRLLLPMCEHD
jgi:SEL1 protein